MLFVESHIQYSWSHSGHAYYPYFVSKTDRQTDRRLLLLRLRLLRLLLLFIHVIYSYRIILGPTQSYHGRCPDFHRLHAADATRTTLLHDRNCLLRPISTCASPSSSLPLPPPPPPSPSPPPSLPHISICPITRMASHAGGPGSSAPRSEVQRHDVTWGGSSSSSPSSSSSSSSPPPPRRPLLSPCRPGAGLRLSQRLRDLIFPWQSATPSRLNVP